MSNNWLQNLSELSAKYITLLDIVAHKDFTKTTIPSLNYDFMQEISNSLIDLYCNHPEQVLQSNIEYYKDFTSLITKTMDNFMEICASNNDLSNQSNNTPPSTNYDRRFADNSWREDLYFNFVKESYLLSSSWINKNVQSLNIKEPAKHYLEFGMQQFLNASCPSNFPMLNPQVIRESISSNGENLLKGMENLISDMQRSTKLLNITTTDKNAFRIGENIAATEGKVVYQNDLMQLICYKPKEVSYGIPILISPPWINKYYILDLSEQNSFVKWLVDHNFQVFMISWVNPDARLKDKGFEDYLQEGILDAINYISKNLNYKKINMVGYCLGGTLVASSLAYLKAKGDTRINSATMLTTLLDFSNPGDIGLFISKDNYNAMERMMDQTGVFDASYMTSIFNILRSNEMIWSYFVNNYLLGKSPVPFDILYWNSDGTNLPAAMHKFYLKNMYIENNFCKPHGVKLLGVPINLNIIDNPIFMLSTKEDHIVPWKAAFKSAKLFSGAVEFCLAASGHVAGVINHPSKNKYSYWVNEYLNTNDADTWVNQATQKQGSWWEHWKKWQNKLSGELVKSINYKNIQNFIEHAPGSYVKVNCYSDKVPN